MTERLRLDPALESRDAARLETPALHVIDGACVASSDRQTFVTSDPSDASALADVARANERDVDAALAAARRAHADWALASCIERARALAAFARALDERQRELAVLASLDGGIPIRAALREAAAAVRIAHAFAAWAQALAQIGEAEARPHGVVAFLPHERAPIVRFTEAVAGALAAGNAFVGAAPAGAPLVALRIAAIAAAAGVASGLVNVVAGGDAAAALAADPRVDALFVQARFADDLHAAAAAPISTAVAATLDTPELHLVFAGAPLDAAIDAIIAAVATGGVRVLFEERIAPNAEARLLERVAALRILSPLDRNADLGPLPSAASLARLRGSVDDLIADGARVVIPGDAAPVNGGFWVQPAVAFDAAPHGAATAATIDGPLAVVMTIRTPEEALTLAKRLRSRRAGIWTSQPGLGDFCAARVDARAIGVGAPPPEPEPSVRRFLRAP